MLKTAKALLRDDSGVIISAELVFVLTIGVLAMVVGLHEAASSCITELLDISDAIGAANQSYFYTGFHSVSNLCGTEKLKSRYAGSSWTDKMDICDNITGYQDPLICDIMGEGGKK